jgi:hypothetical protein
MNFSYDSFSLFKKIEVRTPTLVAGMGQYLMDFDVLFSPQNPPKGAVIIDDLHVSMTFGSSNSDIGIAYPAPAGGAGGVMAIRRQEHGHYDASVKFRLYLMPSVLEAIEVMRSGGDATFSLRILGRVTGYDIDGNEPPLKPAGIAWVSQVLLCAPSARVYSPVVGSHEAIVTVPQSTWTEILTRAGFTKTILLEIPVLESGELGVATAHIKNAQTAFSQGRYADTVDRCRDALDVLIPEPRCPWSGASTSDKRKRLTVEDSFRLSWGAVRQITHATHHRNSLKSEFTRPMAQYVLGATTLALSLASKEKDLFAAPVADAPTNGSSSEN